MKILPYDPKSLTGAAADDDARLGAHVRSVSLTDLPELTHGIVIIGLADDAGIRNVGGRPGAAEGPRALRQKLYRFTVPAPRVPLYDLGDLLPLSSIEETHRAAVLACRRVHEAGHTPVVIGGGHDLGFPPALALLEAKGRSAFCNIDAHLDVRPTTHGITSGSPWFLLREHPLFSSTKSQLAEFGLQPHCNAAPLVEYAGRHRFDLHWLGDLRKAPKGVAHAFAGVLKKLSRFPGILVSFDIDSVQWADAPGCSSPQTLGFTAAEAVAISELAGSCRKVKSFGLFELSPPLDPDGRTSALAAHCINAFLKGRGAWQK
jgi:formiminoglutamase